MFGDPSKPTPRRKQTTDRETTARHPKTLAKSQVLLEAEFVQLFTFFIMAKILLIGDSTLTCNKAQLSPFRLPCRLSRCSVVSGLGQALGSRTPDETHIIICAVSSFASSSLLGCTDDKKSDTLQAMLDTFFDTIFGLMSGVPDVRIYLCEPIPRLVVIFCPTYYCFLLSTFTLFIS